ncbi:hypothetical protein AALP_AA6G286700 [Arabis alpina]|uniref:Uncharacterized protein n=1 Tax=Arabis alpina TaxID=50452 RepID=A0A087GSC0_ARAAL|nr:hypothetical protein AALP_AA6G286700 [Arabis alpina]
MGRLGVEKEVVTNPKLYIKPEDPLFGVLKEDQVGVNPATGRLRIVEDVLDGIRLYLLSPLGEDLIIKRERAKKSVNEILNNPALSKGCLHLEFEPLVSADLDKGKGIVFGYNSRAMEEQKGRKLGAKISVIEEVVASGIANSRGELMEGVQSDFEGGMFYLDEVSSLGNCPTDYRSVSFEAGSFGTATKKKSRRKRPHINNRRRKAILVGGAGEFSSSDKSKGKEKSQLGKRKAVRVAADEEKEAHKDKQRLVEKEMKVFQPASTSNQEVVPSEGPSNA